MPAQAGGFFTKQSKSKQPIPSVVAPAEGRSTAEGDGSFNSVSSFAGGRPSALAASETPLLLPLPPSKAARRQPRRSKSAGAADHAAAFLTRRDEPPASSASAPSAAVTAVAALSRFAASVFGQGRHHGTSVESMPPKSLRSLDAQPAFFATPQSATVSSAEQAGMSLYESIADCASHYDSEAALLHMLGRHAASCQPPPLPPPRQPSSPGRLHVRMSVFGSGFGSAVDSDYESLGSVQGFFLDDGGSSCERPRDERWPASTQPARSAPSTAAVVGTAGSLHETTTGAAAATVAAAPVAAAADAAPVAAAAAATSVTTATAATVCGSEPGSAPLSASFSQSALKETLDSSSPVAKAMSAYGATPTETAALSDCMLVPPVGEPCSVPTATALVELTNVAAAAGEASSDKCKQSAAALPADSEGSGDGSFAIDMTVRSGLLQPTAESLWQRHLRRTAARRPRLRSMSACASRTAAVDLSAEPISDGGSTSSVAEESGSRQPAALDCGDSGSCSSTSDGAPVSIVAVGKDASCPRSEESGDADGASHYAELVLSLDSRVYASLDLLDAVGGAGDRRSPTVDDAPSSGLRSSQPKPDRDRTDKASTLQPSAVAAAEQLPQPRRRKLPFRFRSRSVKRQSPRATAGASPACDDVQSHRRSVSQDRESRTDGEEEEDGEARHGGDGNSARNEPASGRAVPDAHTTSSAAHPTDESSRTTSIPLRLVQAFTSRFRSGSRVSLFAPVDSGGSGPPAQQQYYSDTVITLDSLHDEWLTVSHRGSKHTTDNLCAADCSSPLEPARTVVLTKGRKGFGFVLRGAKADQIRKMGEQFFPSERMPALQYLDSVEKGSIADKAGLKAGDFIVELNGIDVSCSCHEDVVQLIKRSGDVIALKVVTMSAPRLGWQSPSGVPSVTTAASTSVSGSAAMAQTSHDASADPRGQQPAAGHTGRQQQPQSTERDVAREEESHILEQLDDTLANYDSQSTSSSTHAGCSGFDVSSAAADAAAAAMPPPSSAAWQPANVARGTSAAGRPPPPQLPLLQRSQSSGSTASMAAVAAAIAAVAGQPAQKVASIRARPASRLITAAAELEGLLSTSWHAGSRASTGAISGGSSGSRTASFPDPPNHHHHHPLPPPPPPPPPPPAIGQASQLQQPQLHSPALKRLSLDATGTAAASRKPETEMPSTDKGASRAQESALVPTRDTNKPRFSGGPAERSKPEIVPLVLDSAGATFSVGNGSDFNTFKGPAPVLSSDDGQSVGLVQRQQLQRQLPHRLPRRPLSSISPLASPDREQMGVFQRTNDACGAKGVADNPAEHSHSSPAVRRYMSQPSQPTSASNSTPSTDVMISSSGAASLDGRNTTACTTSANAAPPDDLSGSQNSINSSGSSSSFADAIRRAASAVRSSGRARGSGSSGAGSPQSDQPTAVVVSAAVPGSPAETVAQKPAPPSRSGVPLPLCKDSGTGNDSRALKTRASSGSTLTANVTSAVSGSGVGQVAGANKLRLFDSASPSEGINYGPVQSGRDTELSSLSTAVVSAQHQPQTAALKLQQPPASSAVATAASLSEQLGDSAGIGGRASSVSAAATGGSTDRDVVSARTKSDLKAQVQGAASAVSTLPPPPPQQQQRVTAADVEQRRDVVDGSRAATPGAHTGEPSALSVKGLRTAFESGATGRVSSSGSSQLGGIGGSSGLPKLRHAAAPTHVSDSTAPAAANVPQPVQANGLGPAVPVSTGAIGDGFSKGPPPPPPAKRVLVKTEHIRSSAADDRLAAAAASAATAAQLLPPPPMFNGLSQSVPDNAGLRVQSTPLRQQHAHATKEIAVDRPSQPTLRSDQQQRHSAVPGVVATEADAGQCQSSGQQQQLSHHRRHHHRREEERLQQTGRQQQQPQQQSSSATSGSVGNSCWRPFMDKHVEVWTVDDVADWLDSVGLSEYRRSFVDNCIEGEALVNLTRNEFKELGIDKVGHRVKFEREVLKLMAVSSV